MDFMVKTFKIMNTNSMTNVYYFWTNYSDVYCILPKSSIFQGTLLAWLRLVYAPLFVCFDLFFFIFKAYVLASNISFSGFHVFLNIYFHISKLRWNTVIHRGTATCSKVWSFIWTCIFQSLVISGLLNGRNARLYCPWGVYADRLYKLLWLVVSRGYYVWDVDWWVSESTLFFFHCIYLSRIKSLVNLKYWAVFLDEEKAYRHLLYR